MKRILGIGLALMLGLGLALPALADVDVTVTVTKDKDVTVTETITKTKDVTVDVNVVAVPLGAAEANALVNQSVEGVVVDQLPVCENVNLDIDPELIGVNTKQATIAGSIIGNAGIVGVNQDVGNANNQGNAYAISVIDVEAFADAQASADQLTAGNAVTTVGPGANTAGQEGSVGVFDPLGPPQKLADMINSMNANAGIVGANQSAGNANNQANAVSVAAGLVSPEVTEFFQGVLVALAEADLGQETSGNTVIEANTIRFDNIVGSISTMRASLTSTSPLET
jgi:hypothetical protein